MIKKVVKFGLLFDFYGKLLSERQYYVMEMFYLEDLSLSEIGIELGITRQGVYDNLKRAEENLNKFEDTLALVKRFRRNHKYIKKILKANKEIEEIARKNQELKVIDKTKAIKDFGTKILEEDWEVKD